jgi:NAD(P)-dependent dehydrogenase (short-subunit alcohol dehydrogenase family)
MTHVLIDNAVMTTGAFGILGSATARAAVNAGARVALIDRAPAAPPGLLDDCSILGIQRGTGHNGCADTGDRPRVKAKSDQNRRTHGPRLI